MPSLFQLYILHPDMIIKIKPNKVDLRTEFFDRTVIDFGTHDQMFDIIQYDNFSVIRGNNLKINCCSRYFYKKNDRNDVLTLYCKIVSCVSEFDNSFIDNGLYIENRFRSIEFLNDSLVESKSFSDKYGFYNKYIFQPDNSIVEKDEKNVKTNCSFELGDITHGSTFVKFVTQPKKIENDIERHIFNVMKHISVSCYTYNITEINILFNSMNQINFHDAKVLFQNNIQSSLSLFINDIRENLIYFRNRFSNELTMFNIYISVNRFEYTFEILDVVKNERKVFRVNKSQIDYRVIKDNAGNVEIVNYCGSSIPLLTN